MDKLMYFTTGDGGDATSELVAYPVSKFKGADIASATTLALFFDPLAISTVATSDVTDKIVLTVTSGKAKSVLTELVEFLRHSTEDLLVVCDSDNSVFFSADVTDCTVTLAA